jgi:hypothetical protein
MYNPASINAQFPANQLICIGPRCLLVMFARDDISPAAESCVWKLARFIVDSQAKKDRIDKEHIYHSKGHEDIATTFHFLRSTQVTEDDNEGEVGRFVLAAFDVQHNLIAYVSFDMRDMRTENSFDNGRTVVLFKGSGRC